MSSNLDIFYTLLIVMAWLLREHRWRSALFLGLAVASKQIAWYFVPFYLIMTWRQYGLLEAVRRLTIAGAIGLAFNLPFIVWDPQAWLAGVFAPVADPMFPMGVGLIELNITHVLPYFPSWVYGILEGGALILALIYVGLVFALGALLRSLFGEQQQNPLVIVASTLIIAAQVTQRLSPLPKP